MITNGIKIARLPVHTSLVQVDIVIVEWVFIDGLICRRIVRSEEGLLPEKANATAEQYEKERQFRWSE